MKKTKIIGISVVAIVIVLATVIGILYWRFDSQIQQEVVKMEDLVEQVTISTVPTSQEKETLTETKVEADEVNAVELMHDFDALKETNADTYAWIQIADTKVDYPILQAEEDNYYLNRNIDGTEGYPGCIYTNRCNSKSFDDYITVIYGHNMKSGEMFATLHSFGESEFFENHQEFLIETAEARFSYQVYAAVNYNDKLIPGYYDVKSATGRDEFVKSLEECRGNSNTHFNDEIEITGEDKLIVLSVCIANQDDRRYLIVAKLKEEVAYVN